MPQPREPERAGAHLLRKVRPLIARQDGVVSREQLLAAGLTRDAIAHARRSGRLHALHRGVYAIVVPELLGGDAALIAALLATGPDAVLSHGTAAWRQRITAAMPDVVHLTSARCLVAPAGVTVHRCTTLRPADVVTAGRFRLTSVARTLLDLAAGYGDRPLLRALEEAEFEHDLRPEDVLAVLRRGHPGSARLRAALARHVPGHGRARLPLERDFRALLVHAGIELPLRNARIGPYVVDCLWPRARVVAELDGRWHDRPHQRGVDSDRDIYLRARGHAVVRYGWRQVHDDGERVAADLRALLARARL